MKVYELLEKHTWEEVQKDLFAEYPNEIGNYEGYKEAYFELTVAATHILNDNVVYIEPFIEDDEVSYDHVWYMSPGDDSNYAIEMEDWRKILGMNIDSSVFELYSEYQAIAHLLFEITFDGYSNDVVQEHAAFINRLVEEGIQELINDYHMSQL